MKRIFLSLLAIFALCGAVKADIIERYLNIYQGPYISSSYKLSEVDSVTFSSVLVTDAELRERTLNNIYAYMVRFDIASTSHDDFSYMSVLHSTDMMGQDIAMAGIHWFNYDYAHDNDSAQYRRTLVNWRTFYTLIEGANSILGQYGQEPTDTYDKANMAQAFALRGMAYYYLIQLYQHPVTADGLPNLAAKGVPMYYSSYDALLDASLTDEVQTKRKGRNTVEMVYAQIEKDLTNAVRLLEDYDRPSKNYINQAVANGLLARYYLLSQQWEKAFEAARAAKTGGNLIAGLNDGFMDIHCVEWMWGFDHTSETQTSYASFFSHISNLTLGYAGIGYAPRLIDRSLYEAMDNNDLRKAYWFNGPAENPASTTVAAALPYASLKFGDLGDWTMDYVYMRVAEMYLIEAEALAHLGREAEAAQAIAPLMNARIDGGWSKESISVEEIYLQRRIELWGEGFSFFDLKRLNKGINRSYEGTNHLDGFQLVVEPLAKTWIYQIPKSIMETNEQLTEEDQN